MKLTIIGASGHGKVVAEIAELCGYDEIVFLDDDREITSCAGHDVIGVEADYKKCLPYSDFFVAIGKAATRKRIMEEIEADGGKIPVLIHPEAVVSRDVKIESGTVVMAGAVINPGVRIGKGCIINTSSSVDHDCYIEDYSHIAVGAHLSGTVTVGRSTWIGTGAIVSNNLSICGGCIIGAGAVVIKDIEEQGTYIGVPAKMKNKQTDIRGGYYSDRIISLQLSLQNRRTA